MKNGISLAACASLGAALHLVTPGFAADLAVVSVSPAPRSLAAHWNSPIVVTFDKPVVPASIVAQQSFWAFGKWSGTVTGSFSFSNGNQTVTLTPNRRFSAGEQVMVILSHDIEATDATNLRSGGYSWQFWVKVRPNGLDLQTIDVLQVRTFSGQPTQAYGALGSDLNGDGHLDLSVVNEITADVRVFLNKADYTGLYDPFLQPPNGVGDRASPNEPSDFNRDGKVDACVANIDQNNVSVLLGNGDGTFAPQQSIVVGTAPRGIAVLDVDGDGDTDIVNTNSSSNNLSLMLNNGSGVFGSPSFFEGGVNGEWALGAADMNNDGLLDLVIGARIGQRMIVNINNGNGTFTAMTSQLSDGNTWQLSLGDVNGDGDEDVAVVNSTNNRGAILLGDGAGGLAAPVRYTTDPFCLATDVGDLDGDGDLDWVTSSFSGDWWLYRNNGVGLFTFDRELPATQASSCSVMLDFDNDLDLDLALIDEIDDTVTLMQNDGPNPIPTVSVWGVVVLMLMLGIAGTVVLRQKGCRLANVNCRF